MSIIGFIGGGNMAQALIKGIIAAGVFKPENIIVADISSDRLTYLTGKYGVTAATSNTDLAATASTIVLSVKPQVAGAVLNEIAGSIGPGAVVISVAAGITSSKIAKSLPNTTIIRVMPNTPALVGQGASALYSENALEEEMSAALTLFKAVGTAVVVEDESLIDAVTAVSGSGPAYFFLLMEEMIRSGQELGLSGETATQLVLQTAVGASLLAQKAAQDDEDPAQLRRKVTSPGGTTEAAINVFYENGFADLVTKALAAAHKRSRDLSG